MIKKIKTSLKNINYKLFIALIVLALCPTIYTTLRVFLIGQLPNEWSYSIAGQLSWINLLYEILNEAIILPLFFFIGQANKDKDELINKIKTGLLITFAIYMVLSAFLILNTENLLLFMATDINIVDSSSQYIKIESIANIFVILTQFLLVVLVSLNKSKYLYILTATRLILCLFFDMFLVSSLPFSLNIGINGIGYSNIVVNGILLLISIRLISKEGINLLRNSKLNFNWLKDFVKIGAISGLESFIRNIAYMLMIARMVNVVGEQGTYWVANNFIWGWLLLPVIQLGELIKQEISLDSKNIQRNSIGYFVITFFIVLSWIITIPLWKPFMIYVLGFNDVIKLFNLVLLLMGFYIFYAFQNIFDAIFYGFGKTNYMLFESVVTNSIYYGTAFILYLTGAWIPTLTGIAIMFGLGNIFDSIVSFGAYIYLLKKNQINIFCIK